MPDANLRKAAVLLLSLPFEQRSQLLGRLQPQQSEAVAAAMNDLGEVGVAERETVIGEFVAATPVDPVRRRAKKKPVPFQFLRDLETDALLDLIADEQPQTVALILSCVPPQQAAAALGALTIEDQTELVCRMATAMAASPQVIADVESALRRRLDAPGEGPAGGRGLAGIVRILNVMPLVAERRLLASLSQSAPQLASELRQTMFGVDVAPCDAQDVRSAAG
jgi:flagellar motor switch protein FliG